MIAEGYTMDIYCDCPACTKGNRAQVYAQFCAEDRAAVTKQAKKAGWYLKSADTRNEAYAPGHWPEDKLRNRTKTEYRRRNREQAERIRLKEQQEATHNKEV